MRPSFINLFPLTIPASAARTSRKPKVFSAGLRPSPSAMASAAPSNISANSSEPSQMSLLPRKTFLPYCLPLIGEEEIQEVVDTLRSGWITTGPKVNRFEQAFASWIGADHAIAVSSCTAALHISLAALDIGPGDEVIVPTMTFCATASVVLHLGAVPV